MTARGRIRTSLLTALAASVVSMAIGSMAFALSIDFTDGSWDAAQGVNAFTTHPSNIDLIASGGAITVNYMNGPSGDNSGNDGLGINDDEITQGGVEQLSIAFSTPVMLNSVGITDLYLSEVPTGQPERGEYSLNGGAFTSFVSVGGTNGALTLNIFQPGIHSILFQSKAGYSSDFSVRGLTYQVQSAVPVQSVVPEPSTLTLLLFVAGFAGVIWWWWTDGHSTPR